MVETIVNSFDIWTGAQGLKAKGRVKGIENISLEGINRLRKLILELALHGKLVAQDSNDEPASELLKKIAKAKNKLVEEGILKKQTSLANISKDEKPFNIPNGWVWTRLGEIGLGSTGKTPSTSVSKYFDGDVPFIGPGQIASEGSIREADKTLTEEGLKYSTVAQSGDILMVCIGGTIGKCAIVRNRTAFNQQINCIRPLLFNTSFLFDIMNATYFQQSILSKATGSATPIINRTRWEEILIPVPSLNEQNRIVEKVDELMALCDKLEEEQFKNLETHQVLVKTLLETLTQATDANELQRAWGRISAHFDTLFCTEDSIDQLKQTILQLAVMGKLVKQNPNDERAGELLKKAAREKEKLFIEGKIKKQTPLLEIEEEEMLFYLPLGWAWARLQEITTLITDGKHGDCQNQQNSGFYFLSAKDIIDGKLNYEFAREINYDEFQETHRRTDLSPGDICMVNTGATVGKLAIVSDDPKTPRTTFQKSVAVIKPLKGFLFNEYLKVFLLSDTKKMLIKSGGSAINNLLLGDLKKKVIPIPPLSEQYKIVTKVNELFTLCDSINEKNQKSQNLKILLSKTIVEKAVS